MFRTLMMLLVITALKVSAVGQSTVTVHFFLPGGKLLDRETEVVVRTGSRVNEVKTGQDGRLRIEKPASGNPVCRIAVRADKRNFADTDISFLLLDGLTDTPVFLAPNEIPKLVKDSRDQETFDSEAPAEAKALFAEAEKSKRGGSPGAAVSYFTRAVSLYPQYLRAINQLGMVYYERNRMDEAAATFIYGLSLGTSYRYLAFNLGAAWLQKGLLGNAMEVLLDLIEKDPGMSEARLLLARALMATQQWDEAALHLRRMLDDPDLANLPRARGHIELSKIYTREERYQSALTEAEKAIAAQTDGPEAVQARLLIGSSLLQLNRFDEAEKPLLEAYSLDKVNALSAQLLLGQIYYQQKKLDAALKAFELYLKSAPNSTNIPLVRQSIEMIKSQMKPK